MGLIGCTECYAWIKKVNKAMLKEVKCQHTEYRCLV
jgi:hypothetical protein